MPQHEIVWVEHESQRIGFLPELGGSVAAWQWLRGGGQPVDLWRPWDGAAPDLYSTASFPLVPWSNRISGGGFEHEGRFHALRPNRQGEPYPIHGDGWLQPWRLERPSDDTVVMTLDSECFDGDPYAYSAEQRFTLRSGGLDQQLRVTHLGAQSLPYGLGLHPYFPRSRRTRLQAPVNGLWLSGDDPLPTGHTREFPPTWDLNDAPAEGPMIDHCYTGWAGHARILQPDDGLQLTLRSLEIAMDAAAGRETYCLLYRPGPVQRFFCFEPITHPIDAFHLPGRPGLQTLARGEQFALSVQWRFESLAT